MKLIPESLTKAVSRKILVTKKNSPHILFVSGVLGVGVSTVLACKATLKLEKDLDELRRQVEDVKENAKHLNHTYGQQEYRKDLFYVYVRGANKIGRLYAPSVIVGSVSIAALTGSHVQLTRRNTALTATLAAVMKAFEDYRVRVQEEIGKEKELDIYQAVVATEVEGQGKNKEITKVVDPNGFSVYARFFDELCPNWQKNAELNRVFLHCQQEYANHRLRARGHVFLNEVYDALGLERSQAGSIVGWIINGEGDNFIDFGMLDKTSHRFINGLEGSILLDFNVDGVIYDKI